MSGFPDSSTIEDFGGSFENYTDPEDPTTDLDASFFNQMSSDVSCMTVTAPRAFVTFVGHATTPSDPLTGFVHAAGWGSSPSVKPVVTHVSTGRYLITFPATVNDPLAVTKTLNFRRAIAQVECGGTIKHACAERTSANTITVYTALANGTLDNLAGSNITCVIW